MRTRQKQLTLLMGCGSIALAAAISATLSADQAPQTPTPSAPARAAAPAAQTPGGELVRTYCVSCHNERVKTANLMLDKVDADQVANSAEEWEKVVVKLRSRAMPPPGRPRPDNATYDRVATWLETELDRAAAAHVNPGRPAELHRLNRIEYGNAIRDLIGVEIDPLAAAIARANLAATGVANRSSVILRDYRQLNLQSKERMLKYMASTWNHQGYMHW